MVIPEMRTAHVPVEIFRLYVEREHIGENGIHRSAYVFDGLARQIRSRRERCVPSLRQLQSFLRIRFVHGILPCSLTIEPATAKVCHMSLVFDPRSCYFGLERSRYVSN